MRKLLRSMAKAEARRRGWAKINSRMAWGQWRDLIGAYPGFHGKKKQKKGSRQPILKYPAPKGRAV